MTKILGLDVGTNSIGWALIEHDFDNKEGKIIDLGTRIIPMSQDMISDFNKGNLQSSAAIRTIHRGVRRLRERSLNRRKRLVDVLKTMDFIPQDYKVNGESSFAHGKSGFKFMQSYHEMLEIFKQAHPELKALSHDWTIYYLRQKALSKKITKQELAWIILQFNKKRGYYQLRDDKSLATDNKKIFLSEIVDSITIEDPDAKGSKNYIVELRNEIVGIYTSKEKPDWIGKRIEFILTKAILKDGTEKIKLSAPDNNDWTLRKKKTENEIANSDKTVGEYIFNALLKDPSIKIRGKEVHTIDRIFYKQELEQILTKQAQFHPEFKNQNLLEKASKALYKSNVNHRENLNKLSLQHLIVNDIIYYQRPLKSKKHLIANCKYEVYSFKKDKETVSKPIKGIAKSHPLFQEYRIWGVIQNLKIYKREHRNEKGILQFNVDETSVFLNLESKVKIYELFNAKKEVTQTAFLKALSLSSKDYRWNYEEDAKLKGNETMAAILKAIKGIVSEKGTKNILHDQDRLLKIWHAIYSLGDSEQHLKKALSHKTIGLKEDAVNAIASVESFDKNYGALSAKAISKLLPLMRCGTLWSIEAISVPIRERIQKIIDGEYDEKIRDRIRDLAIDFDSIEDFQGCPEWFASYLVYNRHSEMSNTSSYSSYEEIDVSKLLPQHSLRNPVVEKILRETMLIVKDVWREYGKPDKIHVELARELKLNAEQRLKRTYQRNENNRINERARAMLIELQKDNQSINPYSIGQLELFKLYEEGATNNADLMTDEIKAIKKKGDPTTSELQKYRLWLDQKYISPYTGQPIPLSQLFTPAYEIEHVIPKSKYYDNSFTNKIICEREANKLKDNQTAYQFICDQGGTKLSNGFTILDKENYEAIIFKMYRGNYKKIQKLLSYEVPKAFNASQLNNTRYISKKLLGLLDPVVRDKNDVDSISSNLLPMVGGITHQLKNDWGLHDKWKELLAPRFRRMNELYDTDEYFTEKNGKIHLSGYDTELKRLDHRHHALDALIVACTSRQHVQYINAFQNKKIRYELIPKLFVEENKSYKNKIYQKPWKTITSEAFEALSNTIVSFKQNHRIINRTHNYYQKYVEQNGKKVKRYVAQAKSPDFWSVRQSMHKDTVQGKRTIREYKTVTLSNALKQIENIADKTIKSTLKQRFKECDSDLKKLSKDLKANPLIINENIITKVNVIDTSGVYASTRKVLDASFDKSKIINKVLGGNTKKDLLDHLLKYDDDHEQAFSPNGLIELNKNRAIPIHKITTYEKMGKKFNLAETGVNSKKYVEADKGTNLFFVIYKDQETGKHLITKDSTLAFGDVMKLMKEGLPLSPEIENHDMFFLSPGDLVYVFEENEEKVLPDDLDYQRIYKCVSFSGPRAYFVPNAVAIPIVNKKEFSLLNKVEFNVTTNQNIKLNCIKLKINNLGQVM